MKKEKKRREKEGRYSLPIVISMLKETETSTGLKKKDEVGKVSYQINFLS